VPRTLGWGEWFIEELLLGAMAGGVLAVVAYTVVTSRLLSRASSAGTGAADS